MSKIFANPLRTSPRAGGVALWVVITILVLAGGIIGYHRWQTAARLKAVSGGIAKIAHILNEVEARQAGKIDWGQAKLAQDLFEEDAVKTAQNSTTLVSYNSGDTIRVEENSLIIIHALDGDSLDDAARLEILMGGVYGQASKQAMQFITGGSVTTLQPSQDPRLPNRLVINVAKDQSTTISVLRGNAVHKRGENSRSLKGGEALKLAAQGSDQGDSAPVNQDSATISIPAQPELLEPLDQATLALDAAGVVAFKVQSNEPQHHIQVAQDPLFEKLVMDNRFSGAKWRWQPLGQSGTLYWNVAAIDAAGVHGPYSVSRSFTLTMDSITPASAVASATPLPGIASAYQVQEVVPVAKWIRPTGGSQPLAKLAKIVPGDKLELGPDGMARLGSSASSSLTLRARSTVHFKQITKLVESGKNYSELELQRGAMVISIKPGEFSWQRVRVGEASFVFTNEELKEPAEVLLEKVPPQLYRLTVLRGEYAGFGSAKPLTNNQQVQGSSLEVISAAPVVSDEPTIRGIPIGIGEEVMAYFTGEIPLVTLLWRKSPIDAAPPYLLEVSRDLSFKNILLREASQISAHALLVDKAATYYWRVQNQQGKTMPISKFTLSQKNPSASTPKRITAFIKEDGKNAKVGYAGIAPSVNWEWKRNPKAVAYQLGIFVDRQKQRAIFQSDRVRQNRLEVVTDSLVPGSYFWQVEHFDYRGKSVGQSLMSGLLVLASEASGTGLEIIEPKDHLVTATTPFVTTGKMRAKGVLTIGGEVVKPAADGSFSLSLTLSGGENLVIYRHVAPNGMITIQNKKIFLE